MLTGLGETALAQSKPPPFQIAPKIHEKIAPALAQGHCTSPDTDTNWRVSATKGERFSEPNAHEEGGFLASSKLDLPCLSG